MCVYMCAYTYIKGYIYTYIFILNIIWLYLRNQIFKVGFV